MRPRISAVLAVGVGSAALAVWAVRRRERQGAVQADGEEPSLEPLTLASLRQPETGERLEWSLDDVGHRVLVTLPSGRPVPLREGFADLLVAGDVVGPNRVWQHRYDRFAPFYDAATRSYARLRSGGDERRVREYLDALDIRPRDRVLEVSVGTGRNLHYLPPEAAYVGLDISIGMLRVCRANLSRWGRHADLVLGTAEHLPFADASFDVVFHIGGINLFADPGSAVAEMARVARPGAQVLVVDETERVARAYRWPPTRTGTRGPTVNPMALVPPGMVEPDLAVVAKGELYRFTFRTPPAAPAEGRGQDPGLER